MLNLVNPLIKPSNCRTIVLYSYYVLHCAFTRASIVITMVLLHNDMVLLLFWMADIRGARQSSATLNSRRIDHHRKLVSQSDQTFRVQRPWHAQRESHSSGEWRHVKRIFLWALFKCYCWTQVGVESDDAIKLAFDLAAGAKNEVQFAFDLRDVTQAQKLKGTLTYMVKVCTAATCSRFNICTRNYLSTNLFLRARVDQRMKN